MATRTKLAAVLNGLVKNVDLTADELVLDSVRLGGGTGTLLTKVILDGLISNSHAPGSDNQSIVAGEGLSGGGAGPTVTLDIEVDDATIEISGDALQVKDAGITDAKVATGIDAAKLADGSVSNTAFQYIGTLTSNAQDQLDAKIPLTEKGANNGVATLDAGGKIPVAQLPSAVMTYEGTWDASTNTPTLADGVGDAGMVYLVSVPGTQDLGSGSISFAQGDWVVYNGAEWEKSVNSNAVVSVNGQTGVVSLDSDDIPEGSTNEYFTETKVRGTDLAGFTSGAGTVTSSDTVLTAIQKLDGNTTAVADDVADLVTLSGVAANATDLGTFTGATIPDGSDIKEALQALETAVEASGSAGALVKEMVAGESYAANTSFLVRIAVTGETAGRVYKASSAAAEIDGKFYAIGLVMSTAGASAADPIDVVLAGSHALGSSDAPFASGDIGKPVFLTTDGAFSLTPPSADGTAVYRIGVVETTTSIFVDGKQLVGVN